MVRNIFLMFIGLVGLFFILSYPSDVIALLNMFVNAAASMAHALQSLVQGLPAHISGATGASGLTGGS